MEECERFTGKSYDKDGSYIADEPGKGIIQDDK